MSMKHFITCPALAVALLVGGQALAQTTPAPQPTAAPAAVPDPARMAMAREVATKLFPLGSYKKMMGPAFNEMMMGMMAPAMSMPIGDIAKLGGLAEEDARALGDAKLGEIMAIYDPHWNRRMKLGMDVVIEQVFELVVKYEPRMQEALARAFAREFTLGQLNDLNGFLVTPSGKVYADKAYATFVDPEILKESTAMMPELMAQMPALMEKVQEALASLPPIRKIADLSDAERKKLAGLLGVKVEELDDPERVMQ